MSEIRSSVRVSRGGSWSDPASFTRSALRFRFDAGVRIYDLGFRVKRGLR